MPVLTDKGRTAFTVAAIVGVMLFVCAVANGISVWILSAQLSAEKAKHTAAEWPPQ
jgi:hypothetical protein